MMVAFDVDAMRHFVIGWLLGIKYYKMGSSAEGGFDLGRIKLNESQGESHV